MLIGNGRLTDKIPLTLLGNFWNGQLQPGRLPGATSSDNFGAKAALPNGYYQPQGWMLPRKGGNLRAGLVTGSGSVSSGTAQSGYNIDATVLGSGGVVPAETFLGLIVSLVAAITGDGGISSAETKALASMIATITGSGDATATAKGLADLAAALAGSGSVNANNTALMDIASTIRGYGDLTPEGIRDSVWNALATSYNDAGTMGNKLNTASSGGVDLNALALAVWTYMDRTLTSGGTSYTPEQVADAILAAAQITPIHADTQLINSAPVIGDGTEGDDWRGVGVPPTVV